MASNDQGRHRGALGLTRSAVGFHGRTGGLQAFGLPADVTAVVEYTWITSSTGVLISTGGRWRGSIGAWMFTAADFRAYHHDARFALLDAAIRAPATDWERRINTALRTLAVSSASLRPSLRITLCATALEALLGDPFVAELQFDEKGKMIQQRKQGQQHLVSRRSAYLTCMDTDDVNHHPRTGACAYMYLSFTKVREWQQRVVEEHEWYRRARSTRMCPTCSMIGTSRSTGRTITTRRPMRVGTRYGQTT